MTKHTIVGRTGRAQLTIRSDMFSVRLLPKSAHRSTSYAAAGDPAYVGPDIEKALLHIRAWTGLEPAELPAELRALAVQPSQAA